MSSALDLGNEIEVLPVYVDSLAPGWTMNHSWGVAYTEQGGLTRHGGRAIQAITTGDQGALFLAAAEGAQPYPRKDLLAVHFWINPGDEMLGLNDLSVAITGSDKQPFWVPDDQSVPQQDVPFAGETRLAYLGLNGPLQARTWTPIMVWLNQLESRSTYITGLYIKSRLPGKHTFYVDDVELIGIADHAPPVPVQAASKAADVATLTFSKELDAGIAADPQHYCITSDKDSAFSSPQSPLTAEYGPAAGSVRLQLPAPLQPGVTYTVQVQGVADTRPQPNILTAPAAVQFTASALFVRIDLAAQQHPISPLIYGVSGASLEYLTALHATLNNWGGNPSTRYNWELGNAWNAGRDWQYRNGDYGYIGASASDDFVSDSQAAGAEVRITLPTLGWVAKDNNNNTCSFPQPDNSCGDAKQATCERPGEIADPNRANVRTDADWVARWVKHMQDEKGFRLKFLAMDNEPDVWGVTHYDVHPKCTTYDEVLNEYLKHATAVRAVAPQAELLGPVSCCWYYYWNSEAGKGDRLAHGNRDFLPWFLQEVRKHDEASGTRTLDVLDIHYYPAGLYNDNVDAKTGESRLRSTRSLWDKTFIDESWIGQPVYLIPHMKQLIAENYPGTKFGMSEWNWGAEKTMNGALAIADVLGILGREDVYFATYWRFPPLDSPGFYAFSMYTNYDGQGGRFGDTALQVTSGKPEQIAAYASLDSATGRLHLMLVNKDPANEAAVPLQFVGFNPVREGVRYYSYSAANEGGIVTDTFDMGDPSSETQVTLPPYSITQIIFEPAK